MYSSIGAGPVVVVPPLLPQEISTAPTRSRHKRIEIPFFIVLPPYEKENIKSIIVKI
jgi:hypothetical protein